MGLDNSRYIKIIEYDEDVRVHYHLLLDSDVEKDMLKKFWTYGICYVRRLYETENGIEELLKYLQEYPRGMRRWTSSLNLTKPKITEIYEEFTDTDLRNMFKDNNALKTKLETKYTDHRLVNGEVKHNEKYNYLYMESLMHEEKEYQKSKNTVNCEKNCEKSEIYKNCSLKNKCECRMTIEFFERQLYELDKRVQLLEEKINSTAYNKQSDKTVIDFNGLLSFCSIPRNRKEIAEYLGVKTVAYITNQYLKPLIDGGVLGLTIPDKPRSKNQKYYTIVE